MIEFTIDYPTTAKERKYWTREYGLNAIYAGKHWAKRQKDSQYWHTLVQSELRRQGVERKVINGKVAITFCWNDRLDIDNHAYMGKMIVDSLKGWLIEDDDRRHVTEVAHKFHSGNCIRITVARVE